MSNTKKILREIASGKEYKALLDAVEQTDYETIFDSYTRISELICNGKGKIEEDIGNLPVRSKAEQLDKFRRSFNSAVERMLPLWHQLNRTITNAQIIEGDIFDHGKKGDPLVRTPEGIIVALRGSELDVGSHVRFVVEFEREKICIGRVFELNPQSFYTVITQEHRDKIKSAFSSIDDYLRSSQEHEEEGSLSRLGELLVMLEEIEKIPPTFRPDERKRIIDQAVGYRKRLLYSIGIQSAFDFLAEQEEKAVGDFYSGRDEEKYKALAALGLFRRNTYEEAEKLLLDEKDDEYGGNLSEIEDDIDSMDSAMKIMEYKEAIDKAYPRARSYLKKMNRIFDIITERAIEITDSLSEARTVDLEEIRQAIENAFHEEKLSYELRKAFKSSKEFLSFRSAYSELVNAQKDQERIAAEVAFKSYLQYRLPKVFGPGKR